MSVPLLRRLLGRSFSTTATTNPIPNGSSYSKPLRKTINKLIEERDLDKLVTNFKTCSQSYRFRCRHNIYSVAVTRLAAAGRRDYVREILDFQKQFTDDFRRSEGFAARIISLFGRALMPDEAASTFNELPKSVRSFNALLTAFADSKDFDRLLKEFREIPAVDSSILPDNVTFNILIRAHCEKGDLDSAFQTLDLMEEKGISPDLIAFNTLLIWFYRNGLFDDSEKIWAKMHEKNIKPDIRSFNAKLEGLVPRGRLSEAVELVHELINSGPKPDTYTFNWLIKGYCDNGKLEDAKKVHLNLGEKDCVPNKQTFEILLPVLCESGEHDLALKLATDSISRKCHINVDLIQKVVDGLVKESKLEEARKLVDIGRRGGYPRKKLKMTSVE